MIGKIIGHRYRILEKVGGGGMAEVYKATDTVLEREVAVKLLRQQYVNDEDFVERFRREAYSASSLSHENVVAIFDVGEENDLYYIVMEYVCGSTLKEMIQNVGSLTIEKALYIGEKIASALQHAHQHHIVHRDIKPHNILIGNKGEVKVTDFGIARAISQATITHTGSVLGSVHYLSPEQARGGWTNEKTDLYSLGIVLYEMITGELPFSGDSPITVALKHLQEGFIYPKELRPETPQSVENIILKALVKDPSKRYESATEMLHDIHTALQPERANEPRVKIEEEEINDEEQTMVIPSSLVEQKLNESFQTNPSRLTKEKRRNHFFTFLPIFIIVLLIGIFTYQYFHENFIVPEVQTPDLIGKTEDEARKLLNKLHLTYDKKEVYDERVDKGYVVRQQPESYPGGKIKTNQSMILYISKGKEEIKMPDIRNKQESSVRNLLIRKGFKEDNIISVATYHDEVSPGEVYDQDPLPNENVVPEEDKVRLFVSKGKQNLEMPNLIGKTLEEAKAIILTNNLEIREINEGYSLQPEGRVFRQSPYDAGFLVNAGAQIDLWVSSGYYPQAKVKNDEEIVYLNEGEEDATVKIIIEDAREEEIIWKEETIEKTTQYTEIPIVLMPNKEATITVYKNNKLIRIKTISYE